MYTLILNAAEGILQFIIADEEKILVHQEWDSPQNGTEKLVPLLQEACTRLEIKTKQFTKIACVVGAGSFTGIRLSLVTAAALARTNQAVQIPIDFMQALAFNANAEPNEKIRVLTHAKRDLVHCADFLCNEEAIPQPLGETLLVSPQEALTLTAQLPDYVLGSGATKYPHIWKESTTKLLPLMANTPKAQTLFYIASHTQGSLQDIDPKYVRTCDAIDNLDGISVKLGNDPQKAHALLNKLTN